MRLNKTFVCGAVAGLLLGALIAFTATKSAMASKQVDTLTAGVFWGCRNAPTGHVLTDEKRCLELSEDMRGMARQEAYKKAHPVLPF
ncbi:hypothetical protein HHL24_27160 [Paraburkholderia sp. RP-4-7]|uniref:Uncharacterized protein n=1 Tax=Paraburkholderia polaris TaxID=2728848 RepID=A0A848IP69_9BURK|nr:hypothetical protein [Paraburkholderia polaris]NMM01605.1 hypothetical protein [Paraburkholderia polaris]